MKVIILTKEKMDMEKTEGLAKLMEFLGFSESLVINTDLEKLK